MFSGVFQEFSRGTGKLSVFQEFSKSKWKLYVFEEFSRVLEENVKISKVFQEFQE